MHKKLIMACGAIAVLASFVIAPAASATTLTESGVPLAAGSSITGKNVGPIRFTVPSAIECRVGHLQGIVTQNNTTGAVKGEIPVGGITLSDASGGACGQSTGKLCWETKPEDKIVFAGCGVNVVIDLTIGGLTCKYEIASMIATFMTNTTPTTFTVIEQPWKTSSALCPTEGRWDMVFALYTTGGTTGLTFS